MTRFATIAALSAALTTPALAHDRCGTEPPPAPAFEQPTTGAEGLAWSIDMLEWTVDWSLDLAEAFGSPAIDRAEIDVAMAALDDLVALVASMERWDPGAWDDAPATETPTPKAGKKGKKRKGTVRARRG